MEINSASPLIIGHRGASTYAPENTLSAFRLAMDEGADGLEFDVRITKDGVPVVFHDSTLRRLAGKGIAVRNHSMHELEAFDVGAWFNVKYPARAGGRIFKEKIPTLEGFLEFLGDYKGLLYLEMKCGEAEMPDLTAAVAEVITKSKLFPQITVKSFNLDAVATINQLVPNLHTAALFAPKIMALIKKQSHLIEKALDCGAKELSLHFSLATQKLVETAKSHGLTTVIWTANHPVWVKRAAEIGLKAVITNDPARLIGKRHEFINKTSILI
jgi:glycerophosphoryl diester phosphodiesterase